MDVIVRSLQTYLRFKMWFSLFICLDVKFVANSVGAETSIYIG